MLALGSVKVAVEDTGVAIATEKDERVREWFQPALYRRFYGLAFLRVVVLDAGLAMVSTYLTWKV